MIRNIFYDFDGVLAESANTKTEAFREMYLPYGNEIADKVVQHHILHGGVSRFEKFKLYHESYLNISINEEEVMQLAREFSGLVLEKVISAKEVEGAMFFLKKYSPKLNFWIITGTPTDEIKKIAQQRQMASFFIGIHGSPEKKQFWTEFLVKKHNLKREETLFLGDATTDYDAAKHSKLHFALRVHEENNEIFRDYDGIKFSDFYELEQKIKKDIL